MSVAQWALDIAREREESGWYAGGPLSVNCDQMSSAAGYVRREFGDYGYRFEGCETRTYAVSVFRVVASDGSRFSVVADRWGNVRHVDTHDSDRGLAELVAEMHARAVAP